VVQEPDQPSKLPEAMQPRRPLICCDAVWLPNLDLPTNLAYSQDRYVKGTVYSIVQCSICLAMYTWLKVLDDMCTTLYSDCTDRLSLQDTVPSRMSWIEPDLYTMRYPAVPPDRNLRRAVRSGAA